MNDNITPEFLLDAFQCPHCHANTQQEWFHLRHETFVEPHIDEGRVDGYFIARCLRRSCRNISIWRSHDQKLGQMLFPSNSTAPRAHEHMPEDVERTFNEASDVLANSPRSAAALLRLGVQQLMPHLGEGEENLNAAIGNLVKAGVPVIIQQALDGLRVVGNNAVHPGQIDVDDDRDTALALFHILNAIIDRTIGHRKIVGDVFDALPETIKVQIKERDKLDEA